MDKLCEVDECHSLQVARGLCAKHYMRRWRTGTTDDPVAKPTVPCSVDGCGMPSRAGGMCDNHYNQRRQKAKRLAAKMADPQNCSFCGKLLPLSRHRRAGSPFCDATCKRKAYTAEGVYAATARKSYYRTHYGMDVEEVDEMVATGSCAICGTREWVGRHNRPHVDHDHKTGRVRGLLCHRCNLLLGYAKDNPDTLRAAIRYLAKR